MPGAEEEAMAAAAPVEAVAAEEARAAVIPASNEPAEPGKAAEKSAEQTETTEGKADKEVSAAVEQGEDEGETADAEKETGKDTEKKTDAEPPSADVEQPDGGDKAAEKDAVEPKKTPRRRAAAAARPSARKKSPAAGRQAKKVVKVDDGEETESDVDKTPRKRAKTATPAVKTATPTVKTATPPLKTATPTTKTAMPAAKKTPVRKKKPAKEESDEDSEDEQQKEVERRVDQLPSEIKSKFGEIVWAKMVGYPFWPSLITDPRLLPEKLQQSAMKSLETKFFLYFYATKDFAAVLHKNIAPWNDEAYKYREGHPEKDSKAPKRRKQLMEAIEEADKELLLPVDQRVDGLLKPEEKPAKAKPKAETATPQPKRRNGKSPAAKTAKEAPAKTVKKGKQSADATEEAAEQQPTPEIPAEEEEEAAITPALSKDEIKAKVASRKTPSRKKVDGADASAKKTTKAQGKANSKPSTASAKGDIDTKRKKEIELVVPHKSVKSADIREATEQAAMRGSGDKIKGRSKDKMAYSVGDLALFSSKMTRLQAKESAKNNDELVGMLNELLQEKAIYRADVERSGLAAIIAVLRKNSNPSVAATASAVRKHMISILTYDNAADNKGPSKKKHAADGDAALRPSTKKPKLGSAPPDAADAGAVKTETGSAGGNIVEVDAKTEAPAEVKTDCSEPRGTEQADPANGVKVEDPAAVAAVADPSAPSADGDSKTKDEDVFKGETSLDKNRVVFVEMLGEVLKVNGPAHYKLAKEIEGLVFDRYKESNGDYRSQARLVIFGLRDNAKLRERLFAGTLHCLEIAYASDEFFKSTE